ncbi:MAG: hypothetical protein A2169_09165 [Deltaproteobacteria bacterium RBG_13_47_9]|nr:MAG: hypothetical protein A2169_09165 [Deltaproteobacteria bacterium RBG_13_47_9]
MSLKKKDWIFVSDAHFTGREPKEMEMFLRFLDSEKERMDHLVILGDLFEFLFGFNNFSKIKKSSFFADYFLIFEALQYLYRQGIRIKYFEGNRDFSLHSFFSRHFNMEIEVYSDGVEEQLGGRRAFVAHGDLANPKQWRYHAFRRVVKNRWTYFIIQLAGPNLSYRIARWLAEKSYEKYHRHPSCAPPRFFRAYAHEKFLEGFEIVILGHSHFPEEAEEWIEGKKCLYFNIGDWMTHRSFLRFTPPGRFELGSYGGENGSDHHGLLKSDRLDGHETQGSIS